MAETPGPEASAADKVVRALAELSQVDLLYADRYLQRAEAALAGRCSRPEFEAVRRDGQAFAEVETGLRRASALGDWAAVRSLADQAAGLQERLAAGAQAARLGALVYGASFPPTGRAALAVGGVLPGRAGDAHEREAMLEHLRTLIVNDPEWARFYRDRLEHYDQVTRVRRSSDGPDIVVLRRTIAAALERADFTEVARVAALIDAVPPDTAAETVTRFRPTESRLAALAAPVPESTARRAAGVGLVPMTLAPEPGLETCVACWCGGEVSPEPVPPDADVRSLARHPCARPCVLSAQPRLWDTLNLLLSRPFVSSAGHRYVPVFTTEHILVEAFSESDPDTPSPLLELLGLPQRRGLGRTVIEGALRRHSGAVCERLGIDPFAFSVVCIPFDAYFRLAPVVGWGRQPLWTHFDGYQLTVDGHLRALVGGDVRYGGRDDLCGVGCRYESEHVTARFAVVRRDRFVLYEAGR